jgi:hypothetical protein
VRWSSNYALTAKQIVFLKTWGWIAILWRIGVGLTGFGLLAVAGWARWIAIIIAGFDFYWVTEDADPPSVGPDRRLRSHQTTPPTSTAAARLPNAIQPHCVLVSASSFLFAAAAAAAAATAGLSPEVVVAATVVVTGAGAATVAVWVRT